MDDPQQEEMTMTEQKQKKTGRYQEKLRQGLVPHQYDKNSKRFALGAHKNWPRGGYDPSYCANLEAADRAFLGQARKVR